MARAATSKPSATQAPAVSTPSRPRSRRRHSSAPLEANACARWRSWRLAPAALSKPPIAATRALTSLTVTATTEDLDPSIHCANSAQIASTVDLELPEKRREIVPIRALLGATASATMAVQGPSLACARVELIAAIAARDAPRGAVPFTSTATAITPAEVAACVISVRMPRFETLSSPAPCVRQRCMFVSCAHRLGWHPAM